MNNAFFIWQVYVLHGECNPLAQVVIFFFIFYKYNEWVKGIHWIYCHLLYISWEQFHCMIIIIISLYSTTERLAMCRLLLTALVFTCIGKCHYSNKLSCLTVEMAQKLYILSKRRSWIATEIVYFILNCTSCLCMCAASIFSEI